MTAKLLAIVQAMRIVATEFPTTVSATDLVRYADMIDIVVREEGAVHADVLVVAIVPDPADGRER